MNKLLAGALAGFAATVPMSWAMELMHQLLPHHESHPLAPRQITENVLRRTGANSHLSEEQRIAISLGAHLGYGATAGTIYSTLADRVPLSPLAKGTAYGLVVWAGSYFGLLPAARILKPATRHPIERQAVLIAAHLIWGSALGMFVDSFQDPSRNEHPAFLRSTFLQKLHPREAMHVG